MSCRSIRGGIGRARAGRDPGHWQRSPRRLLQAHPHRADRVRGLADPVGAGFVDSLARPGGNATGFMRSSTALGGKWLELLKQIAPGVTRVAVLRDPTNPIAGVGQFGAIQAVAPSIGRGGEIPSTCATPPRSSAPSRHSRAVRTAA